MAVRTGQTWPIEATAIDIILLLNPALGLYQERRSEAALARLKALAGAQAWELRDGHLVRLAIEALVPDDRVRLESGDRVPAVGTLVEARGVLLDESILTGESMSVDKGTGQEAFSVRSWCVARPHTVTSDTPVQQRR